MTSIFFMEVNLDNTYNMMMMMTIIMMMIMIMIMLMMMITGVTNLIIKLGPPDFAWN